MPFYQRKSSNTYHTQLKCSKVPRNVKSNKDWTTRASKPKGKMCVECAAKERPPVKAKKKAPKKKAMTAKKKTAPKKKKAPARRKKR